MPKTYPTNVSRTLDPTGKSLITVVGLHDRQITDADINLIQDLQDSKRERLLADQTTSGAVTYSGIQFQPFLENIFLIPSFDALFNGEVVTITGFQSADQTTNRVVLPAPAYWTTGANDESARVYVVFLELWYQALDAETGEGYYTDPMTGLYYFFPYGNISPDPSNANELPDDSIDPFEGLFTTERAQIQWRLNVQRVSLNYNFSQYKFGLDPDTTDVSTYGIPLSVYGQAGNTIPVVLTAMQFANMGTINGDTALWRAGDGNVNNALGTMDGYSYAMPVAVVFQRNSGPFSLTHNLFGCAVSGNAQSGLLQYGVSGRLDSKLADQIFADDCVDTRSTINLGNWDMRKIMAEGFVDIITGASRYAISRGASPGNSPLALGSTLSYTIAVSPTAVVNADTVGQFDGFSNGFSTDQRIFETTKAITISQKSVGIPNSSWVQGDAFTVQLPPTSNAAITDVAVTALVNSINGTFIPVNLLQGQLSFTGLGSNAVTVQFVKNLTGTPFDPSQNNLYVTLSVQYSASSGIDLRKIPFQVNGGSLQDAVAGNVFPVFGVSEYQIQSTQPVLPPLPGSPAASPTAVSGVGITPTSFWAINPEYSNVLFGTRIWLQISGAGGSQQTVGGSTTTTFVIPRGTISGTVSSWYCTRAWDLTSGAYYNISSRTIASSGTCIVTIQGAVSASSTVVFSFIGENTCQLAYNAPVKGATVIEETVLVGNVQGLPAFACDNRVSVVSILYDPTITNTNTVVLVSNNAVMKGISGDDTVQFIWVQDTNGNFNAVACSSVNFNNGVVTVVCPASVNLLTQPFFFVASLLPAFDPNSILIVESQYVPYQGEGATGCNYEILYNEDNALITTNGTGASPVVGLSDVYPYNRELPIVTTLPSQVSWNDSDLENIPLETFFDDNFSTMRQANVEDTFLAPLHTNDFIVPVNRDIRKEIQFVTAGGRGFATAIPHLGYAIKPPVPKTVLGQNLQSTVAPIIIYVNNISGDDSNNGLTAANPVKTFGAAMALFPPVLRHPCSIQLVYTGVPYAITSTNSSTLVKIPLGDGAIIQTNWYALANIAFTVQGSGRFVVSTAPSSTFPVVIDASAWTGFGDGPTSAFFVDTTRVIFNNIQFQGFTSPAIKGINSDIEFVDCTWQNNVQAGSFEQGCGVVLTECSLVLGNGSTGIVATGSELTISAPQLTVVAGATPGPFFVAERQSNMTIQTHGVLNETNVAGSTVIAEAEISSSIVCNSDWQSSGSAVISVNSALSRTVLVSPFLGGITVDTSSSVVTNV